MSVAARRLATALAGPYRLEPELAAELGAERFVVEIKTTAALQHPHILPLFDSGAADGLLVHVMPLVEGERHGWRRDLQRGEGAPRPRIFAPVPSARPSIGPSPGGTVDVDSRR